MNERGADALVRAAVDAGVELCFANPGTTEMELVAALDTVGMAAHLVLHETVAAGAADGYARVSGRPAMVLVHLGPGLGNALANLHNARRAGSPAVVVVGDHASWHLPADAPLTTDIDALAATVSTSVRRVGAASDAAATMAAAVADAVGPPPGVATVVVPQDAAWGEGAEQAAPVGRRPPAVAADADSTDDIAAAMRAARSPALLLGGVVRRAELEAAVRIAGATGATVWADTFCSVLERGRGIPAPAVVPYFADRAIEALAGHDLLVTAGTRPPVAFFGYRSVGRSMLAPESARHLVAAPAGWPAGPALQALAETLGGGAAAAPRAPEGGPTTGALDPAVLAAVVAGALPEGAVVVEEALTSAGSWPDAEAGAAPHETLRLTGGAIGDGMPMALGAAVGAPGRRVVALQADGSGLYSPQALWTMARAGADVTVVVCANAAYRILEVEQRRTVGPGGPTAASLMHLTDPTPDWCALASAFGVPARRVATGEELAAALGRSFATPGPALIEATLR
ncbi:MAG TPA: acetolactate synthase large subunit [Acidimicrobiales bacterium]|nr:acetolactate synthase large subunit [Acidimicrobiales bacterium]